MVGTASLAHSATPRWTAVLAVMAGVMTTGFVACAPLRTPVAIEGSPQDMGAYVGRWTGTYESPVTGRTGGIVFSLRAAGDSAFGNVQMLVRDTASNVNPKDPQGAGHNVSAGLSGSVLTIRFVRADSNHVSGRLDPYIDPSCSCTVSTVFSGALSGDVIRGTFTTTGRADARSMVTGTWMVRREH